MDSLFLKTIGAVWGAIMGSLSGETVAALVGALVGAGTTAVITIWYEGKQERKSRALSLIDEYTSPDFVNIRNDAGRAMREAFAKVDPPSWNNLFDTLSPDEWRKISKIKHFYEKMNFLVGLEEVDTNYIDRYFTAEFWHWHDKYFARIDAASPAEHKELNLDRLKASIRTVAERKAESVMPGWRKCWLRFARIVPFWNARRRASGI